MKCQEIHSGLDNQELRDWIASKLGPFYKGEKAEIEREIARLQKRLDAVRADNLAREVMALKGWFDHDVSDHVEDYSETNYRQFVGTEDEVQKLLDSAKCPCPQ